MKAKNCEYSNGYVEILEGDIAIHLDEKCVRINTEESIMTFEAAKDDPVEITVTKKQINGAAKSGNTLILAPIFSQTLIVKQKGKVFTKNMDDVALQPFTDGVVDFGLEWDVASDMSSKTFKLVA